MQMYNKLLANRQDFHIDTHMNMCNLNENVTAEL